MRYLNLVVCLLMLLFIGVQYNDPDGPMWMLFYGVPAVWAGMAFFRSSVLRKPLSTVLLICSILLSIAGVIYFWPTTPGWWASDVWYETEAAREGMGMMIVTGMLLVTWGTTRKA